MEDKNTELDELDELDTEADTVEVEDVEDIDTDDDEFEYDEDGNIIIPDVLDNEEEDAEVSEDNGENAKEADENEEAVGSAEQSTDTDTVDRDELLRLRERVKALEIQSRDTLEKLGVKSDDVMDGLVALAAEADGVTKEEYIQSKKAADREALARSILEQQEFEKIASADLSELHAAFPETKQYKHVRELPDEVKQKFARYRELGLPAKDAYAAANPDGIRSNVATAVKKQALHESKSHLKTTVPKGSKDHSVTMTRAELSTWRDLFPGMSDKEIEALYKKTAN